MINPTIFTRTRITELRVGGRPLPGDRDRGGVCPAWECRWGELGAVSRSCACIGSPCLRQCAHGASIGGAAGGRGAGLGPPQLGPGAAPDGRGRWRERGGGRGARRRAADPIGGGESFLRVHWVAVPEALRARRVNRSRRQLRVGPWWWAPACRVEVPRRGHSRWRRRAGAVSRPFPSWNRSRLTEIYLSRLFLSRYIEDRNGRARATIGGGVAGPGPLGVDPAVLCQPLGGARRRGRR
jgi:hypothetical protein